MNNFQAKTVDIWLKEKKYAVADEISNNTFISPSTQLELIKIFLDFPYPPETVLAELSYKFVIPFKQLLDWFSNKRIQNRISWSSQEIDYARATILNYNDQMKPNIEHFSSHDSIISDISSKESVDSLTQVKEPILSSTFENLVNIFIMLINFK